MSQAHPSYYNNYTQDYQGYQQQVIPQYQHHASGYPQQNPPFYNPQGPQQPHMPPNNDAYQTPVQQRYAENAQQGWLPQPVAQQMSTVTPAPMPSDSQASYFAQRPPGTMAPSVMQGQFSPSLNHQVRGYAGSQPAATPPMRHHSVSVQSSYQNVTTPPQVRRPLPTPNAVARPLTQPPPVRRPLPAPQGSPSAPTSPIRHRPSLSVSSTQSFSSFSTEPIQARQLSDTTETRMLRPLPHPIPRSTKSLDLTRSLSPANGISDNNEPLPQPGQKFVPLWKRALPSAPEQQSNIQPSLSRTVSALRPLPSPGQQQAQVAAALPPPPRPPMNERAHSTGTTSSVKAPNNFPLRDRVRTLPDALPAPTIALPHRPDSVIVPKSQSSMLINRPGIADSPISSESEDLHDNALLHRPPGSSPIVAPPRASSPPPATVSRFIERSPERGRGPARDVKAPRRLSLVSRMAEMSMVEAALGNAVPSVPAKDGNTVTAVARASTQHSIAQWPSDLPRLPVAPQPYSQAAEQRSSPGAPSPAHPQPSMYVQGSPTHQNNVPPSRGPEFSPRYPPPPQHPASPTARRFPSRSPSREPSPSRTEYQEQRLPPLPSRNNPPSPIRPRFPRHAPEREPALPAPRAQRMFPNLDDAPPPSLRRTPSPSPTRTSALSNGFSYHPLQQNGSGLPNIRTQDVGPGYKMTSPASSVTPNSASSAFSLSAFPIPPQQHPTNMSGFSAGLAARKSSSTLPPGMHGGAFHGGHEDDEPMGSANSVSGPNTPAINVNGVPDISINVSDDHDDTIRMPMISFGGSDEVHDSAGRQKVRQRNLGPLPAERSKNGLFCGGCGGTIIGRAVYTTDASWHPRCLKCTACGSLLENLAVHEYEGRPYCSLDYFENFAPRCHHCQTAIADPNYITLKDEQLGERTYHEQHFFCAECGDPFLPPSTQPRSFSGDGTFGMDEGCKFIVYNRHPYCEGCHVRLRMPKCKKCSKSLRLDDDKLEFLGAKYCPECFVCKGCDGAFVGGQLFVRDKKPFCRRCYDIIVKSEL